MLKSRNFEERANRLTLTKYVSDKAAREVSMNESHNPTTRSSGKTETLAEALEFKDDRQDQRTLRGLLVDIALEVYANFFLDYRPVGALFRIRSVDGF